MPQTTIIPATQVLAAFASGGSFLETPEYRVGMARREGPGDAEVHDIDTDIFYVLEGRATLVSGGEMWTRGRWPRTNIAPRAPGEARPARWRKATSLSSRAPCLTGSKKSARRRSSIWW